MTQGQLSFFDPAGGEDAATAAIQQVEENADPDWMFEALQALYRCALAYPNFTTDDIWPEIPEEVGTHEPRAMGAITRQAVALGWIIKTSSFRKSKRKVCHRNPKQVWQSNLYQAEVKQA